MCVCGGGSGRASVFFKYKCVRNSSHTPLVAMQYTQAMSRLTHNLRGDTGTQRAPPAPQSLPPAEERHATVYDLPGEFSF